MSARIRCRSTLLAGLALVLALSGLNARPEARMDPSSPRPSAAPQELPASQLRDARVPWVEPDGASCPPGWCDTVKGRVLIKVAGSGTRRAAAGVAADLRGPLASYGVGELEPVFPQAVPPRRGARVFGPDGSAQPAPDLTRWYAASIRPDADPKALAENLRKLEGIETAEPDYLRRPIGGASRGHGAWDMGHGDKPVSLPPATPQSPHVPRPMPHAPDLPAFNDPLYAQQWHLGAVNAPAAWAWLEAQGLPPGGSRGVVVAVIDTGVDYLHPDLAANIWTNAREIPANGVDDDGNGYVDDVHGIDATVERWDSHSGNPMDDHGHGTHVAGIVAAQADNAVGGVGVAWNVQVMAIKSAQYSGVLATTDIAEGIYYAAAQGADVINMSFGGYAPSQVEHDALAVAFGQAVLVAAAGNDNKPNDWSPDLTCGYPIPIRRMYPANHNWVLGVMASNADGRRASFSNYDCIARNANEYELHAPGVDIWSTLPNAEHAAWDGTSMATPVVAGIAALIRTAKPDKDAYPSRYIMGQIASNASPVAQAFTALTVAPQPQLSYLRHWVFDSKALSPNNDGDGVVDAGETIDLAIVVRNHWGKADDVVVTLDAWADGAVGPDPFVTIDPNTVNYGAIGSFGEDDNGLTTDEHGEYVGVLHPFRAVVSASAPNNHVIPLRVTMSARNGFDAADPATYTTVSSFTLAVQRGRELPRIIESDMTLTADDLWIIRDATLVKAGVTLRIGPGTQVQFWGNQPEDPYAEQANAILVVEGTLDISGNAEYPVRLFPSELYPSRAVDIRTAAAGELLIAYADVMNPHIGRFGVYGDSYPASGSVNHSRFTQNADQLWILFPEGFWYSGSAVAVTQLTHSSFRNMGTTTWPSSPGGLILDMPINTTLFDGVRFNLSSPEVQGCVFLKNGRAAESGGWVLATAHAIGTAIYGAEPPVVSSFHNNAILNLWRDPDPARWMRFFAPRLSDAVNWHYYITGNFWGGATPAMIDASIHDWYNDFSLAKYVYQPVLDTAPETAYPFVVTVDTSSAGTPSTRVGPGPVTFTVTFNRDMDQTVQPQVSFGPDVPMTDYTVHQIDGGWQDARTWVGTFNITPITGDGYQLIRVTGARAADDPWLVTGDDAGRFRFEIITSGTEAMSLQATGGEGYVDLQWTQNDFDLLAGYHLYRSTSAEGPFTRINGALIARATPS